MNGAIPVEVRLAVALRILAGASYWDVALMFGLAKPTVYLILWQVIDAINNTPAVGAFYFPQDEAACLRHAEQFKVGVEYIYPCRAPEHITIKIPSNISQLKKNVGCCGARHRVDF